MNCECICKEYIKIVYELRIPYRDIINECANEVGCKYVVFRTECLDDKPNDSPFVYVIYDARDRIFYKPADIIPMLHQVTYDVGEYIKKKAKRADELIDGYYKIELNRLSENNWQRPKYTCYIEQYGDGIFVVGNNADRYKYDKYVSEEEDIPMNLVKKYCMAGGCESDLLHYQYEHYGDKKAFRESIYPAPQLKLKGRDWERRHRHNGAVDSEENSDIEYYDIEEEEDEENSCGDSEYSEED